LKPPLFIASESRYPFAENKLYHEISSISTIHLGNPGLEERVSRMDFIALTILIDGRRSATLRLASASRNVAEAEREKRAAKPEEP
jgi:hypothetical protein